MILRLLVPAVDHPGADTPFAWPLADSRGQLLREGTGPLSQAPRAETVEAVLPASRVLFARLRLPKVCAGHHPRAPALRGRGPPRRRPRADPFRARPTNAAGETLVAVVDRSWLGEALAALDRAGFAPARAYCIKKVVPTPDDVGVLLRLLARSAIGEPLSSYTTLVNGARRTGDRSGPTIDVEGELVGVFARFHR